MRNIEQLAAYVPYMVSIGNHEDSPTALAHFSERFRHMPSTSGDVKLNNVPGNKTRNTWYYSWDAGLQRPRFRLAYPGTDRTFGSPNMRGSRRT